MKVVLIIYMFIMLILTSSIGKSALTYGHKESAGPIHFREQA
jgi:hypothetical protein